MKHLIAALLATSLAATAAEAVLIRYEFEGTLAPTFSFPPGSALEAGSGLPGSYSGFVTFDTAAVDVDASLDNEVYLASSYALTAGNYSLPGAGDFVIASINPGAGSFVLSFQSPTGFDPGALAQNLIFSISFTGAFGPGLVQTPLAAAGLADLSVDDGAGSFLLASGDVTQVNATLVPEPASWALMIAGFGLIGGALRRARGRVPHAAFEG